MNKTIGWIVVAVVILGLGYWVYSATGSNKTPDEDNAGSIKTKGSVIVSFTDAAMDIQNVNDVSMKVSKVELYSATQGWVLVSNNQANYNLLDLNAKGHTVIYGTGEITADSYSKTRVTLDSVTVMTRNDGNKVASMPSKILNIDAKVNVFADSETSLKFDVLADKSLHATANNQYVFAPVVKVESRSRAEVTSTVDGLITVNGGTLDTNSTFGMNLDGSVQSGFELKSDVKLDVGAGGVINLL
jgi:hypothetical protein